MLELLHIENIAVIELADIAFRPGFNALTGETGAGKSIVIDAMEAVCRRTDLPGADSHRVRIKRLSAPFFQMCRKICRDLPKTVRPRMRMAILRSSARSAVRGKAFAA